MATPHTDRARTDTHKAHSLWNPPDSAARQSSQQDHGVLAILCFRPRRLRAKPVCNWRITPARLCAWGLKWKKILEMKSRSNKEKIKGKIAGNNGEQACPKRDFDAFSNIMELAHNICSSQVDRNGSFNGKISSLELDAQSTKKWNFLDRKYYFIGPA